MFTASKFFLGLSLLFVAVVSRTTLFPFIVGKYSWFRTGTAVALILFLLGLLLEDRTGEIFTRLKRVIKKPLVIAVIVFTAIFALAGFLGVNPTSSIWSSFERGEGVVQILHLAVWFLLAITLLRDEKDWERVLKWAIAGGLLMVAYGVFAGLGVGGFIGPHFGDTGYRFQGSIGNPAYVASHAIFMLFYITYLALQVRRERWESKKNWFLYILGLIFLWTFFAAATRGAFLGLIASLVVAALYFMYTHKAWRKKLSVGVILLFLIIGGFVYFKDTPFVTSIPGSRIFDITTQTKTFEDRAIMWRSAVDGWKERPLLGWGPENYLPIFDKHFNTDYFKPSEGFGAWFDRAHSIYFDYLAETGILGLVSFLAIFVALYVSLIKYKGLFGMHHKGESTISKRVTIARALFIGLPVAYLVQGLVLFDVLPIYVNLFLFLALIVFRFDEPLGEHGHGQTQAEAKNTIPNN